MPWKQGLLIEISTSVEYKRDWISEIRCVPMHSGVGLDQILAARDEFLLRVLSLRLGRERRGRGEEEHKRHGDPLEDHLPLVSSARLATEDY